MRLWFQRQNSKGDRNMNKKRKEAVIGAGCCVLVIVVDLLLRANGWDFSMWHVPAFAVGAIGLLGAMIVFVKGE
jgi:hypothetical protein